MRDPCLHIEDELTMGVRGGGTFFGFVFVRPSGLLKLEECLHAGSGI